jgi:hypothetical protein
VPPPTLQGALKVQGPVFIRKLARASHWGQPDIPIDQRVQDAVKKAFRNQPEPEISIYRVSSDEELRRVTVGMNANRSSLHEALAFAVLLPEELEQHGIQLTQTPGDLKCEFANRLHYDAVATDQQLEALCRAVMMSGRTEGRCPPAVMKDAAQAALAEGCAAATNTQPCRVAACVAPPSSGSAQPDEQPALE